MVFERVMPGKAPHGQQSQKEDVFLITAVNSFLSFAEVWGVKRGRRRRNGSDQ